MKKLFPVSAFTAVVLGGLIFTGLPAAADDNTGLNVDVYVVDDGQFTRDKSHTLCTGAWTHVDNIDADFDGLGAVAGCRPDQVLVRYTGFITFPDSGSYSFVGQADDGFWLTLDGNDIITGDWYEKPRFGNTYPDIAIVGGQEYVFDAWFFENGGGANVTLQYMLQGRDTEWITVPPAFFTKTSVPKTFDVAFDTVGGKELDTITYTNGAPGIVLPTPSKDGYLFLGWAKGAPDGLIIESESYVPDSAVTLYALWAELSKDDVKRTLADTGFSPWPLAISATLLIALGLVVIRKSKHS
jgi:hypothetical protein